MIRAPVTDRQREEMRLRAASPKRANAGKPIADQRDAGDCPLFIAANEPRLL